MNNTLEPPEPEYGIFSDLPPSHAEGLYNSIYYSDAFGVFAYLMGSMDVVHHVDLNSQSYQDTSIRLSLNYLLPLLKAGKLKIKVPVLSLRTARTQDEYNNEEKLNIPHGVYRWIIDEYRLYSKPEEADEAVAMVWTQWEKLKKTPPKLDELYKKLSITSMSEAFLTVFLTFTLPHRPFWNDEQK